MRTDLPSPGCPKRERTPPNRSPELQEKNRKICDFVDFTCVFRLIIAIFTFDYLATIYIDLIARYWRIIAQLHFAARDSPSSGNNLYFSYKIKKVH